MARRLLSGVALGTHAADEVVYSNWVELPLMGRRGIGNRIVVTPDAAGNLFDVQIRQSTPAGELFFEAEGADDVLEVSVLWAYETVDESLWVAIRNRHSASRGFELSSLRAETVTDNTVLHGTGAPDNAFGDDDDFYIDASAWLIYGPKAGGVWPTGVSLIGPPGEGGEGGGGGSTKVTKSNVALGTQSFALDYTWYEITAACTRGLVSRFKVSAEAAGSFDVQVRSDEAGGGDLFFEARAVEQAAFEITWPFYVEGTADSIWLGIRNNGAGARTFTLTDLRLERFA